MKPSKPIYAVCCAFGIENAKARMATRVLKMPSGCWEWQGYLWNGYGKIQFGPIKFAMPAHRVAWALANEKEPGDMLVCHRCDNRRCVNPDHLWLGTNLDNARDMQGKGRRKNQSAPRKRVRGSKLTLENVELIRSSPLTDNELAAYFSVHPLTVCRVRSGHAWSDEGRAARRAKKARQAADVERIHNEGVYR